MVGQTVALCRQLGAGAEREDLLEPLARAACERLGARLRGDVTAEDCGGVFPLAAALLVLDALRELDGESAVTAFTAGEVTIRREGGGSLTTQAERLLAPWCVQSDFAVMEVMG